MRVLQVLGRSAGGIARHVGQITAALDGLDGFEVDIAGPPDLPIPLPKEPIPVEIPDGPFAGHLKALRRLREVIDEGHYDVVHAHGLRAGIDSGLAVRGLRPPVFLTVHNLVRPDIAGRTRSLLYRRAETVSVRLASKVFAVSDDITAHLAATIEGAPVKVETLYLGIGEAPELKRKTAAIRGELGLPRDVRLIVTAARLAKQKALPVMIEAVAQLDKVVLAILGLGPLEAELRDHAKEMGAENKVRWLGFREDAADYIAAADIFCLSSTWEGVPLAAQEAILLGTPVVSTDVGGMAELIDDRRTGRLVPPGEPSALAAALDETLKSPEDRRAYARRARTHLKKTFSTEAMLDRLAEAYKTAGAH